MTSQVLPEEAKRLVAIGLLRVLVERLPEGTPFPRDEAEVLAITGADRAQAYAMQARIDAIEPELYDLIVNHGALETAEGFERFRMMIEELAKGPA